MAFPAFPAVAKSMCRTCRRNLYKSVDFNHSSPESVDCRCFSSVGMLIPGIQSRSQCQKPSRFQYLGIWLSRCLDVPRVTRPSYRERLPRRLGYFGKVFGWQCFLRPRHAERMLNDSIGQFLDLSRPKKPCRYDWICTVIKFPVKLPGMSRYP